MNSFNFLREHSLHDVICNRLMINEQSFRKMNAETLVGIITFKLMKHR